MAWIESHQSLRSHPKTRRLARALDVGLPTAIGHLHCLWWWALDYASDGNLEGYEPWELSEASLWEGDPEVFVGALESSAFVVGNRLHDWDDYAGRLISARNRNRERQAAWRNGRKSSGDESGNGVVTVTRSSRDGATVPNRTVQNRTVPNQTEPQEDAAQRKAPSRKKGTTAIDPSWLPSEASIAWAEGQGWPSDWVARTTDTFRDYYLGTGKMMTNWDATWRNWLRRDAQRSSPTPAQRPSTATDWFGD